MDNKNFVANEDATFVAPPRSTDSQQQNTQQTEMTTSPSTAVNHPGPPPDYFTDDLPPAYQVASALPTYEEAELTKEGKLDPNLVGVNVNEEAASAGESSSDEFEVRRGRTRAHLPGFTLLTFPMDDTDNQGPTSGELTDTTLLGNDFVFFTAFTTSFLFNWIGFLLTMCFCRTIAAWYGALAGFGLSLAKWTLIVKHSTDFASGSDNTWLWWLFTTFGLIVCMRAIFQYLHIKRSWSSLSISARERLFFY